MKCREAEIERDTCQLSHSLEGEGREREKATETRTDISNEVNCERSIVEGERNIQGRTEKG